MTINVGRAAVLVIDMHRGSLEEPGTVFVPGATVLYRPLAHLLENARKLGVPVVYLVHQTEPDGRDARHPFWLECEHIIDLYPNVGEQVRGSVWTEVPDPIAPKEGDLVLPKKRYGAFTGNGLAQLLRMWGIDTLVLTGVLTEICVLATAFDAFNQDYRVLVASDCVKGLDPRCEQAALTVIAREVGWVLPSEQVTNLLSSATDASRVPAGTS